MKNENFSVRLRELRRGKNISQAGLGKIVNLHYTHIGRYERGISMPGAETLKRLAEALGVTTDFLIEGTPDSAAKARLEDRELLQQFQEIEKLAERDRNVVKIFLDAFLTKKKIQSLAA